MIDEEKESVGSRAEQLCRQESKVVIKRDIRLAGFCDRFDTGSLFWLQSILTDCL